MAEEALRNLGGFRDSRGARGILSDWLLDWCWNVRRRAACVALAVVLGPLVAACSQSGAPYPTSGSAHAEIGARIIADATAAGASEQQLGILERAAARGEVTWDDLIEALQAFGSCLDTNGLFISEIQQVDTQGVLTAEYTWGAPLSPPGDATNEQLLAIGDQCLIHDAEFVEQYYYYQPSAQEAWDRWFATVAREPLIACLKEHGVEVDDEATPNELLESSESLFRETAGYNDGGTQELPGAVDCAIEAGF